MKVASPSRVQLKDQSLSKSALSLAAFGSLSRLSHKPYPDQDGFWSWVVCLCGTVCNVVLCGFSYSNGILFPVLLDYFQQDTVTTAWVGSLFISISFLLGPVASSLCDRYGCRTIAICGACLSIMGLLLSSQARSIYTMYLTLSLIVGFGSCCGYTSIFVIVPRMFDKRRALAMGITSLGPSAGIMIMAPVLQSLLDRFGWRGTFLIMAGITGLISTLFCTFDSRTIHEIEGHEGTQDDHGYDWSIFKNREFIKSQIATLVLFLGITNVQMFLVAYCSKLGIKPSKASILYLYMGLMGSVGRVVSGRLCDWPRIKIDYYLALCSTLGGTSVICLPFIKDYVNLIVFAMLYGILEGSTCITLAVSVLESVVNNKQRSSAMGLWFTSCAISMAAAPPLIGSLVDKFGSYAPGFFLSGTCITIGGLIPLVRTSKARANTGEEQGSSTSTVESLIEENDVIVEKLSVV